MIEIDGVKYEKVIELNDATCDGCDRFDMRSGCRKIGCGLGGFILKRIKEEVMFKKGDRVVCVASGIDQGLTSGQIYNVLDVYGELISVINNDGLQPEYFSSRFKPAPQYTTRPIDYTGCDPVIAEHLKRGKSILCEVWGDNRTRKEKVYVANYDKSLIYKYGSSEEDYQNAKPIPRKRTETRVKKASEIVAWLEDNGYAYNEDHNWTKSSAISFTPSMFEYCGKVKPSTFIFISEWLEEVTVICS